jgi:hypothetical protein
VRPSAVRSYIIEIKVIMILYRNYPKSVFFVSYALNFLFVAFIGTHIPLMGLLFFYEDFAFTPNAILIFTLDDIAGSGCTLTILKQLIKPIKWLQKL